MKTIRMRSIVGPTAEDKDTARTLRESIIRIELRAGETVTLDFEGVDVVTQSFIHALISDLVRRDSSSLDNLVFTNCAPIVRTVITTVVDYSQDQYPPSRSSS
jgi:hypothetical protein